MVCPLPSLLKGGVGDWLCRVRCNLTSGTQRCTHTFRFDLQMIQKCLDDHGRTIKNKDQLLFI